jgi:energy-coupling factor transporter ATP-binding protein EcfA2
MADENIKAHIIKRYLPAVNILLKSYLQRFGSDIIFEFDEEFDMVVKSRFKEKFSFGNFSEGQKRRIDLAIMFTFIMFCKTKHRTANTNLLMLDEVGIGMDAASENMMYEILKELVRTEGKSILTISHSTAINPEHIQYLYEVDMEKGFSKLIPRNI